jgi:hypothetical protein
MVLVQDFQNQAPRSLENDLQNQASHSCGKKYKKASSIEMSPRYLYQSQGSWIEKKGLMLMVLVQNFQNQAPRSLENDLQNQASHSWAFDSPR